MTTPPGSQIERADLARKRVGSLLADKWTLEHLLGLGGMASVYGARHRNGKTVAIKILHAELAAIDPIRERFVEEGYTANRVGGPGVVSVLDEGTTPDGCAFLVMELLEGQTFEDRLQSNRPGLREVLCIADSVLQVLERAHERGIVHRDIKPENIFITQTGDVKLLDFGIARVADSRRTHATEVGTAMGTPVFMPPEQARGRWELVDGRADLWSLGATLYTAITGRLVHEAPTLNEELLLAMTARAPSLGAAGILAPKKVVAFVDRALAYEREDRFPDATAMRVALCEAIVALDRVSEHPTLFPPSKREESAISVRPVTASFARLTLPSFKTRRKRIVVGLSLGIGLSAVFALVTLMRPRTSALPEQAAANRSEAKLQRPASAPEPIVAPSAPKQVTRIEPNALTKGAPEPTAAAKIQPPKPAVAHVTSAAQEKNLPVKAAPSATAIEPSPAALNPPVAPRDPLSRRK
jgi:eukaryotic-like serine/threonine-protein kinase